MRYEWYQFPDTYPPNDDYVLVTCRNAKGKRFVYRAFFDGKWWHGAGSMSEVVAWCPLPEPAKIGGEDGKTD